jgi:sterol-4alpha-carboxylate 3-dehydrogenase (decarboxylating)
MILKRLDLPTPTKRLPYWFVYGISVAVLFLYTWVLHPLGIMKKEPTFSPMRIALAGRHHYYSCKAAVRDLGYKPVVGMEEGVDLAVQDFMSRRLQKK